MVAAHKEAHNQQCDAAIIDPFPITARKVIILESKVLKYSCHRSHHFLNHSQKQIKTKS